MSTNAAAASRVKRANGHWDDVILPTGACIVDEYDTLVTA